jgi:lipopolysaccharide/colanic/teichoic acid biosynthesis glycosyltransferase
MMAEQLRIYEPIKRAFDLFASGAGLILVSPVLVVVSIAVAVKLGRPVLFVQNRPGKNGKVFRLYKFRTMKHLDSELGQLTDEQRLTPLGQTLRSTSLDELPALLNVLKGDMSLVGPRPLLVSYLERYNPYQARRHDVRPGITGLAQISGRNSLVWDEKFALDIQYVDNRNFRLDMKILWSTIQAVMRRDGINAAGEATMSEFIGNSGRGPQSIPTISTDNRSSERR